MPRGAMTRAAPSPDYFHAHRDLETPSPDYFHAHRDLETPSPDYFHAHRDLEREVAGIAQTHLTMALFSRGLWLC